MIRGGQETSNCNLTFSHSREKIKIKSAACAHAPHSRGPILTLMSILYCGFAHEVSRPSHYVRTTLALIDYRSFKIRKKPKRSFPCVTHPSHNSSKASKQNPTLDHPTLFVPGPSFVHLSHPACLLLFQFVPSQH